MRQGSERIGKQGSRGCSQRRNDGEVKPGSDIPTQISIEDTYKGLNGIARRSTQELRKLSASLLRRMHADLTEDSSPSPDDGFGRNGWPTPKTLRLSTAPKWTASEAQALHVWPVQP